jgi:hypothetical protein
MAHPSSEVTGLFVSALAFPDCADPLAWIKNNESKKM